MMHTVKKQARRERADGAEGFAAIQLLHDPQVLQACFRGFHGLGICQNGDRPAFRMTSRFWSSTCELPVFEAGTMALFSMGAFCCWASCHSLAILQLASSFQPLYAQIFPLLMWVCASPLQVVGAAVRWPA